MFSIFQIMCERTCDKLPVGASLDSFYSSVALPNHLRNLLHLQGVTVVEDLLTFDDEAIKEMVDGVRDGSLMEGYVDMSSKIEQKKYFGALVPEPLKFHFRPIERTKLGRIAEQAKLYLEGEAKRRSTTARQRQRRNKQSQMDEASRDSAMPGGFSDCTNR